MHRAVDEMRGTIEETALLDIVVLCDGIWKRRGFASLNGIVTVISVDTGKVIDFEVLHKKCALGTAQHGKVSMEPRLLVNSWLPLKIYAK